MTADNFAFEKAQYLNQNILLANLTSKVDKAAAELKTKVREKEANKERILQEIRIVKTAVKHRMVNLTQQLSKVAKEIESIVGIQKSHKRRGSLSDYGLTTIGQTIPKKRELDLSAMYGTPVLSEPNLVVAGSEDDDGGLNAAQRLSEFSDRLEEGAPQELSTDSLDDEDELNDHMKQESVNTKPAFPQNFHIGMDFKKKSTVPSRRETVKEDKINPIKAEPSTQSLQHQDPQTGAQPSQPVQHHLDSGLETLLTTAHQLKAELVSLREWLLSTNSRLRLFNLTAQSKMNEVFTCKNCFQKYRLTDNHPGGCMYHSGRLRYLSCLECGALEYFTCCRVCSKCRPGCNTSLHSPLVQYSITK